MVAVIIGSSGQLGRGLLKVVKDAVGTYSTSPVEGSLRLEVTDYLRLEDFIIKRRPEVVYNATALTDVDGCERDRNRAFAVNAEAVRHMARASRVVGSLLVHFSTDYVFDGEKGMYREEDTPNPINYYGMSKLVGEAHALSYDQGLVIRTSGVFGYKPNFPLYVAKRVLEGKEVTAWDSWYSPIHADTLAEVTVRLVSYGKTGLFHVAGERVSRYELARRIAGKLGGDMSLVRKVGTPSDLPAKRPKDSSLDSSRAFSVLGVGKVADLEADLERLLRGLRGEVSH